MMRHVNRTILLLLTLGLLGATGGPPARPALAQAPAPPNIVLILTDDLNEEVFNRMPRLRSLLTDRGVTFANSFVSLSLCCPSRATTLTGQYAHNTRIFTNALPGGGFQKFHDLDLESSTVATWLQDAGYRTVLMGKYLNGYPGDAGQAYIPPGWDEWYSPVGGTPYSGFNYRMNENGQIVWHGSGPNAYMTDVLSRKANNFIRRAAQAAEKKPFFMYIAAYAPHGPATPAPRHADAFPDAQAPRTRSFNESNVSDKPAWVQTHPRLTASQVAAMDALYRKRLQSMLAVEDLVDSLIRTLENTGELDNTYVFFTSDNGFHQGQHRLNSGKNTAFEEDLRVPLVVRGPGVPAGGNLDHLAANLDLAATFAELAGVAPPEVVDGRSLAPLLTADPPLVGGWRRALLLEHGFPGDAPELAADDAEGALEPADPFDEAAAAVDEAAAPAPKGVPVFQGLRTAGRVTYIEYSTGERELYRLSTDPDQLANAYGKADPDRLARLASWLDSLRRCAGAECRAAEDGPP